MDGLPLEVAVLGSCITRDNFNSRFNPGYKRYYTCPLVQNQSSLIALMSEPVELDGAPATQPTGELSDYARRTVRTDLTKEFLGQVVDLQPDYLILDFFGDIHFGCLRLEDGRYLTNNRWKLWKTDLYRDLKESGGFTRLRIQDDTEEYVALWRDAFDRFYAFFQAHLPHTTLVLHRGFNTDRVTVPGRPDPMRLRKYKKISRLNVPKSNRLWAALDDYVAERSDCEVIDLTARGFTSFAEHPWGPFYVHYTMDYYHQFLAELHKIHLRRAADLDVWGMVEDIDDAGVERYQVAVAASRRKIRAQRARIQAQAAEVHRLSNAGVGDIARRGAGRLRRAAGRARSAAINATRREDHPS
ncbi:MAG: DUF6270 domain-containing protein [Nocardioidaceae bacterium]